MYKLLKSITVEEVYRAAKKNDPYVPNLIGNIIGLFKPKKLFAYITIEEINQYNVNTLDKSSYSYVIEELLRLEFIEKEEEDSMVKAGDYVDIHCVPHILVGFKLNGNYYIMPVNVYGEHEGTICTCSSDYSVRMSRLSLEGTDRIRKSCYKFVDELANA